MLTVNFTKLLPEAKQPTYATEGAAGLDLYAVENVLLSHGVVTMVGTGIAIELPPGWGAQIRPRSSMGLKGILIANSPGTIDSDYRGEILIELMSMMWPYQVNVGDRIAQLVIQPVHHVQMNFVDVLSRTSRGAGGCGSTGR